MNMTIHDKDKRLYKKGAKIVSTMEHFINSKATGKIPNYIQKINTAELRKAIDICDDRMPFGSESSNDPDTRMVRSLHDFLVEVVVQRQKEEDAERCIKDTHILSATERKMGIKETKPIYKVVSHQVVRSSYAHIDTKIVSVASCLPGEDIDVNDSQRIAQLAFKAIQYYASIPSVQAFFLAPFLSHGGKIENGSVIPLKEQCRLFAGG
jgi:hypothetical protein